MSDLSKTQVDRLGDRLRKGNISEADLKMLDDYRKSFSLAYGQVIKAIENFNLKQTGRPAKSTTSIIDKLHRESIRLSQIQDIAGCRIVVENVQEQNRVVEHIRTAFSSLVIADRRLQPSYGYRAVHLIVKMNKRLIEIQVRTTLQHEWAELSEKFSDKIDPLIKYGGGNEEIQKFLLGLSRHFKKLEDMESAIGGFSADIVDESQASVLRNRRGALEKMKKEIIDAIKQHKVR